jgi:hypothetical protein
MNQETLRTLADKELSQVILWAQDELREREEKRKQDTIAKIKELAGSVGVQITINGKRGRPGRKPDAMAVKAKKA